MSEVFVIRGFVGEQHYVHLQWLVCAVSSKERAETIVAKLTELAEFNRSFYHRYDEEFEDVWYAQHPEPEEPKYPPPPPALNSPKIPYPSECTALKAIPNAEKTVEQKARLNELNDRYQAQAAERKKAMEQAREERKRVKRNINAVYDATMREWKAGFDRDYREWIAANYIVPERLKEVVGLDDQTNKGFRIIPVSAQYKWVEVKMLEEN